VYLGPTSLLSEQVALDANGDGNLSDNQSTRYVWQAELSVGGDLMGEARFGGWKT